MSSVSQRKIFEGDLRRLYIDELLTDLEIAQELGCTKQAVYLARKKFNIGKITPSQRNSKLIIITSRQEEIIRGSLLGDAWIEKGGAVGMAHGKKQFEYIEWLSAQLRPYFGDVVFNKTCKRIRSCSHEFGKNLYKEYYPDKTKRVNLGILNKLTDLSIAVWFMDDGQVLPSGAQSRLATCSFTEKENTIIVNYFYERWGISGSVRTYGGYRYIYFNKENTNKLVSLIRQHIPLCMRYKIWHTRSFAVYMSGGMEYKNNLGREWREWLTEELDSFGYSAIDPVKIEPSDENGNLIQARLMDLKCKGDFAAIRELVQKSLFRKDMFGIQLADMLVVLYDKSVQLGAGTLSEAWESFREGRPVYLVTHFPLEKIPTWLIGETTEIFSNFEDFLSHIKDHDKIVQDMVCAEKMRREFISGIY